MAKDRLDNHTRELIQKKIGRPALNTDFGPMSAADRQRRLRNGKKSVQILMSEKELAKLQKYCSRHAVTRHSLVCDLIKRLRLTIPPDF